MSDIDCDYTDNVVCPYCGYEFEDDGETAGGQDEEQKMYCDECDKSFIYTTSYSITYNSHKCKCLNGAPHIWEHKEYNDFKDMESWRCKECGKYEYRKKV